ncbi:MULTISPECIES: J domain-containing protein [Myroides]|uniref:DnaJ domain-containing protein n=1 Tax=Myroides albus TaxID=2562892 RepID=A0A6I3LFG7_9FLAO|nr:MULTISPECIES: DnaJ domain-containing protein [Myroides]MTG98209.1 DnaJ domain-containing protein [Myroides albus]MVX36351.1 DnaJ domain-containing protein [Myroides sp. LoEW2-1]UVD79325.1 DnaJ domain-containing protein [Myroides albus]
MNKKESYTILGLEENASIDEIKLAYRKLAKQYHPDRTGGDEFFTNMFRKINQAYENLLSNHDLNYNYKTHSSQENTKHKRVILNPNVDNWIEKRHQLFDFIDYSKRQLDYLKNRKTKRALSLANILKLVGIALLIAIVFNPYTVEKVTAKPKDIKTTKWKTTSKTSLYPSPDSQTHPIGELAQGQPLDSIGATKYFFKVQVLNADNIQTGYVLKRKISK